MSYGKKPKSEYDADRNERVEQGLDRSEPTLS
jgi:hypothetical protein